TPVLKCHAGCDSDDIRKALRRVGLLGSQGGPGSTAAPDANTQSSGCSLLDYSRAKRLPISFLQSLGVGEISLGGSPALKIPYLDGSGREIGVRFRSALTGEHTFRWRKGSKATLYGQDRLDA